MNINNGFIGVVGAGQMGSGIAQVSLVAGHKVILQDVNEDSLFLAKKRVEYGLKLLLDKQKIDSSRLEELKKQIHYTVHLEELAGSRIVIEAIIEDLTLKQQLFKKLDSICNEEAILATNTSSISITSIAAVTSRPDKVIGMHFMNPVPLMKLIEIIRGLATSEETFNTIKNLGENLGKTCVVSKDFPGFIVNRILMPMINEAVFCIYEGLASIADVDAAMKLGTNQPMGPLALADFIGLDTCLAILNVLYTEFGDSKYRPCPLLKQYVMAGYLGKKSGKGFYDYTKA